MCEIYNRFIFCLKNITWEESHSPKMNSLQSSFLVFPETGEHNKLRVYEKTAMFTSMYLY